MSKCKYNFPNTKDNGDTFQITDGNDPKTADSFPREVLFSLAQKLDQPVCADVEFIFPAAPDGATKRLYAISTILENRSSYFSRSISLPLISLTSRV